MSDIFCVEPQAVIPPNNMKEVTNNVKCELDFINNEVLSNRKLVRELVAKDQFSLSSIIKKEEEDMREEFVDIKNEIYGDVTFQMVSPKQEITVKGENIQKNLLNTISIKDEEKNAINELVSVYKSEAVSKKEDLKTECVDAKQEILKLVNLKEEEKKLVKELVSAYERKQIKKEEDVRTKCVDVRKEILRPASMKEDGKLVRKMLVTVYKSLLTSKKDAVTCSVDTRNKVVEDKHTETSDVPDKSKEKKSVKYLVPIINYPLINVDGIITKQLDRPVRECLIKEKKDITKQVDIRKDLIKEQDKQCSEADRSRVVKEFVMPVEIDTILKENATIFRSMEKPAADKVTDVEENMSGARNDQRNKVTEAIESTDLCVNDKDATSAIDVLCAQENTSDVMDIEFIDCSDNHSTYSMHWTPGSSETCSQVDRPKTTAAFVQPIQQYHFAQPIQQYQLMTQCDSDFMRLPPKLSATRGVMNVQNIDNKSFLWSILAALYPTRHSSRTSSLRKNMDKINMSGIEYPVSVKSIDLFEQLNPDLSVNVLGYEDEVYPVRMSPCKCRKKQIYLMLLTKNLRNHYCLVTRISRLLYHLNKRRHKSYYCCYCLQRFTSEHKQKKHLLSCESSPLDIETVFKNLKCQKHTPKGYMS